MKVYIISDMEGTAGVSIWDQVQPSHPKYAQTQKWMTQEINAAADGAFTAGANLVLVHDTHMSEHNLDVDILDPRVEYIMGGGISSWAQLDDSFDMCFLIGAHSKAGTPNGNLRHTWNANQMVDLRINGISVGEIGLLAAGAGELGVPCTLITGDDKACLEAAELIPQIVSAIVKTGLDWQSARLIHPHAAQRLIFEKSKEACSPSTKIKPLLLPAKPVIVEAVQLKDPQGPYDASSLEMKQLLSRPQRTSKGTGENIPTAFNNALV
ncbi:MAG: M55 family metallopeptidase [Phycisphaerae bacterium]